METILSDSEMKQLTEEMISSAKTLDIILSEAQIQQFCRYYAYLKAQNSVMDLTAVTGAAETAQRHFADSLTPLLCEDFQNKRVLDVGSGAGFPGVPLWIAEPSIRLTLLDSQQKRVGFLSSLCALLHAEAECIHARAEEQALLPAYRERYDIVLSRAVARLNLLSELCLPFVKVGGCFLAMKAADSGEELEEAKKAIGTVGGTLERTMELPVGGIRRRIYVIRKVKETPKGYPRRYARMVKKPI